MNRRSDKFKVCGGMAIAFVSSIHVFGMFLGFEQSTGTDLVFAIFGLLCGYLLMQETAE